MSLSQRFFTEALRDMQQTMSMLEQPLFNAARRSLISAQNPNRGFPSLLTNFPTTDMVEHQDGYELQAELPGMKKEDVQIELADSQTLVLKGTINQKISKSSTEEAPVTEATSEAKTDTEATQVATTPETAETAVQHPAKQQWWVNERVSGSFSRTFSFPTPINANEIKAKYEDGVLKIDIPKSTKQVHQINIE
ncbi:HSP20-like chaperone [Backusella circina FSU 941]|nr:HSP20-like chaperone [Backusella circina FSU 941]